MEYIPLFFEHSEAIKSQAFYRLFHKIVWWALFLCFNTVYGFVLF